MADPKLAAAVRANPHQWYRGFFYIVPSQVQALLTPQELIEIKAVCSRCLFGSLFKAVVQDPSYRFTHVRTGDINSMSVRCACARPRGSAVCVRARACECTPNFPEASFSSLCVRIRRPVAPLVCVPRVIGSAHEGSPQ